MLNSLVLLLYMCEFFCTRCKNESVQLRAFSKGFFFFWSVFILKFSSRLSCSVDYSSFALRVFFHEMACIEKVRRNSLTHDRGVLKTFDEPSCTKFNIAESLQIFIANKKVYSILYQSCVRVHSSNCFLN